MSGLRFESSDEMNDRVIDLLNGAKPKTAFDKLTLREFQKVNKNGGFVTLSGDLPDPVEDYDRHVED